LPPFEEKEPNKNNIIEDNKMADPVEEKSNFTKILVAMTIISVTLVLVLKDRETDHLTLPGASTTLESNAAALQAVKRFDNNFTE
jgi:hypothetical protein